MQPNSIFVKAETDVDEVPTLVFLTAQISSCLLWGVCARKIINEDSERRSHVLCI